LARTISLDYSHIHLQWPPKTIEAVGNIWADALAMIEAILHEQVVASSGWIDGNLRGSSLHQTGEAAKLLIPNLQSLRVRSWTGTFDRDEVLQTSAKPASQALEG
jgi:hypothetical protein